VMSTFFSAQTDAAAVSDLRAWSEDQLIAAAKSGEELLRGALRTRYEKVSCVTRRIMRKREDAEDAAQECFLNAFVHLRILDGRSSFFKPGHADAINSALMFSKRRVSAEIALRIPMVLAWMVWVAK